MKLLHLNADTNAIAKKERRNERQQKDKEAATEKDRRQTTKETMHLCKNKCQNREHVT